MCYPQGWGGQLAKRHFSLRGVSSTIAHEAPTYQLQPRDCGSLLALPGPPKGLLYAHCTGGSPRPARLVFLLLCFWPGSGMAGSPDHLALRATGVSVGQVGRTSPSDPRLREAHPRGYFWLFQVGPGLLPPQRAPAAQTWWPAGSHMMSSILLARGRGDRGREHPTLRPSPLSQEAGWGQGGIPRHVLHPRCPEQLSVTPCPGFQSASWSPLSSGWL